MLDEQMFRRIVLRLLERQLDVETTVTAIGMALAAHDEGFEQAVSDQRGALERRARKILEAFEHSKTEEWLALLLNLTDKGTKH